MPTLPPSDELKAFQAKEIPEGFEVVKIVRAQGPTLRFHGKLLCEEGADAEGKRERWTELRLWETPGGKWIAEKAQCSDRANEGDIADAMIFGALLGDKVVNLAIMDFFGWTGLARSFARKMKWRFEEFVD